ncbi:MAG: MogA/MoaB family molybdenum cofactor biosynthesis protein [Chloroflexota bacterium]|nr:MogA/MoaB family molybdenum cofactor biosynthesis protein [Chloroflexota bacterium]
MKKFVSITVSDSRSINPDLQDISGTTLVDILLDWDLDLYEKLIMPDDKDKLFESIEKYLSIDEINLIITTGGTGISERDITPEVTNNFIEKNIPGIPELIRNSSYNKINTSVIYRGLCGIAKNKILLNLPGSPSGVKDGLGAVKSILPHIFEILGGKQGH